MKTSLVLALLSTVVLGCGKDDVADTDAGSSIDAAVNDMTGGSTDQGRDTGVVADMASVIDTGQISDMGGDMAPGEDTGGGEDMGAGEDTGTMDMGGGDGPCAAGYTAHEEVAGAVVACEGAADSLNQCDAEAACGGGWHMCTAAEYRAHFEAVEPAAAANASYWLASCIRDGAAPTAPSGVVCADCTGTQTGSTEAVASSCVNGLTIDTDQLYVGVRAGTACTFAGVNAAGNDAFWNAQPSNALQAGAFCCVD